MLERRGSEWPGSALYLLIRQALILALASGSPVMSNWVVRDDMRRRPLCSSCKKKQGFGFCVLLIFPRPPFSFY